MSGEWLQIQSLWDLEAKYVFNRLSNSLARWQQLFTEIKRARRSPRSGHRRYLVRVSLTASRCRSVWTPSMARDSATSPHALMSSSVMR
ncbi:hypothetical protein BC834DRAFT_1016414 [Gloeopeniophorella convolvens]|nr:hypothetical protein BC834DRAFT_1016414 [Gloeopeniophorella convolvens]